MKKGLALRRDKIREKHMMILRDYFLTDGRGNFVYTVSEIAKKYGVSEVWVYKLLKKYKSVR